jgi:hypothetical protein
VAWIDAPALLRGDTRQQASGERCCQGDRNESAEQRFSHMPLVKHAGA